MAELVSHEAFEKRVRARRSRPGAPLPAFDPARARKRLAAEWKKAKSRVRLGTQGWDPVLLERARAASAFLEGRGDLPADVDVLAVVETLARLSSHARPDVASWIAHERGLATAVDAKLRSLGLTVSAPVHGSRLVPFEGSARFGWSGDDSWEAMRALVCAADDASYTAAREVAAARRIEDLPRARVASSFFFPDEPWANEDLAEALARPDAGTTMWRWQLLLASASDPALVRRVLAVVPQGYSAISILGFAPDLLLALPTDDAIEIFLEWLDLGLAQKRGAPVKTWLHALGAALGAIDDDRVASRLAPLLVHDAFGPGAVAYFERAPHLATRHLAPLAKQSTKLGQAASAIVDASARGSTEEAREDELPDVLRRPPWREKRARRAPPIATLQMPPFVERIEWAPGERERAMTYPRPPREMTEEERAAFEADPRNARYAELWWRRENGTSEPVRVPTDLALARWNTRADTWAEDRRMLAIHGEAALPGLFLRTPFLYGGYDERFVAYLHVVSPRVALACAEALRRRKAWRPRALRWLADHPDATVAGLLPIALDARRGEHAASALRLAAASGARERLLESATAIGPDARAALEHVLAVDPLTELDVSGELPPFVDPARLPRPTLASGRALPEGALVALLDMLRASPLDPPYAGLAVVRETCEPASLLALARALTSAWLLAGGNARHAWALSSFAHLAAEARVASEAVRTIAPLAREWARKDAKKAALAIDVLAAIGTDGALLALGAIAERGRIAGAKDAASAAMRAIAEARGLTLEELEDRAVPDLELDADGTTTLDYGSRRFTVSFDELLRPRIRDAEGRDLPALPRATKADDAAKAKSEQQRFRALREGAEAIAEGLLRRFERAMVAGRTWPAADFETLLVRHPLAGHVVRRLVWAELGDGRSVRRTFRVAEDRSLADADDAALSLSADAVVALPHPLSLAPALRERWIGIFADYGIVQPFDQLGRVIPSLDPAELAGTRITRTEGRTVPAGVILGALGARGWERGGDWDHISSFQRELRTSSGAATAILTLTPGFSPGAIASAPLQTMSALRLDDADAWSDVEPIDLAELLRDLDPIGR